MKVALVLQARMGSTRLPGKTLMDLAGKPLLARILERVKRCQKVDSIIVATTNAEEDDPVAELARDLEAQVFRGSQNDLIERHLLAAEEANADLIARLPADNPCPEPSEIDRIVEHHITAKNDFSSNISNVWDNGYPDGIGAEVFPTRLLREIWESSPSAEEREHPHLYFHRRPERFQLGTLPCPSEFRRPELVLDVNTQQEYLFIRALYEYLYPRNPQFTIVEIIDWYDRVYQPERRQRDKEN